MSDCDVQLLAAYHDGELAPAERARVEAHVSACARCARELALLRETSALLLASSRAIEPLNAAELARLHDAIDRDVDEDLRDDGRIWRIGSSAGLIAASILIIGLAWLNALPRTSATQPGAGPTVASLPGSPRPPRPPGARGLAEPWERMAVTLRVDPLPTVNGEILPTDTQLPEWMLEGLASR